MNEKYSQMKFTLDSVESTLLSVSVFREKGTWQYILIINHRYLESLKATTDYKSYFYFHILLSIKIFLSRKT